MDLMNLNKLTDFDFECLCKDLFEGLLNVRLEIFAAGSDGGIDLRHMNGKGEKIVIQCKHWMTSGRTKLVKYMIDQELPKVRKLRPTRYIIASTIDMTRDAKDKLYGSFQPFITSPSDIFGIDEISSLIKNNPRIVRKHIRLWLNDVNVLEAVISKNILWRSMHFAEEIQETLNTYVSTSSLVHALNVLESKHVCIITGSPGVGKTTLAQVLGAYYAHLGYELIQISENIEDALRMWDPDAKQAFFYDDFLGQSVLELHKNEDSRLISLMKVIGRDPKKRFICTTRGHIFAQGKSRYERLDREDFGPVTCLVDLDSFSRETKARILYNHAFWSDWPASERMSLAQPQNYRKIIDHPHFNPRVISGVLGNAYDPRRGNATSQLVASLDDPTLVWRNIFEEQISDKERGLLVTLFSLGGSTVVEQVEEALLHQGDWSLFQIRRSLRTLDGTFIKQFRKHTSQYIEFDNPAVNDFLLRVIREDASFLRAVLLKAHSFDQVANIWLYHSEADTYDRVDLGINLNSFSRELEEAALATLDISRTSTHHLIGYIAVALEISSHFKLPRLERHIAGLLSVQGRIYCGRYEDIAEIIRRTANSRNPEIRNNHTAILMEGLTALFNRDRSAKGLFTAAIYAQELAEFVDGDVRSEIVRQAMERADHLMDLYESGSPDDELDALEFAAALEYMGMFSDRYSRWPMAGEAMDDFGIKLDDAEDDEEDMEDEDEPEWSDGPIYRIMRFLTRLEIQDETDILNLDMSTDKSS